MSAQATAPPPLGPFFRRYALAWAGGTVAYVPILTLLLPMRFTELAGAQDVEWLARTATAGAIAASLAGILWGWLSDRIGRRLALSAVGLILFAATTLAIGKVDQPASLLLVVVAWQVALNLYLAPLSAFAAERVPDSAKGTLGGYLAFAPAIAALSIGAISLVGESLSARLVVIVAVVAMAALPLLASRRRLPPLTIKAAEEPLRSHRDIVRLWFARLLVQVAEGLIFVFLYYYLRDLSGGSLTLGRYAAANIVAQGLSIPVALAVGRYSDRHQRRRAPLLWMIAVLAAGLVTMALANSFWLAVAAYGLFLVGSNSFLALHAAFTMQQLPDRGHYGRDLGIMNLTNTLPAVTTPLIAAVVIGWGGFPALLALLAMFMLLPAAIIFRLDLA